MERHTSPDYQRLGSLYLAALSNAIYGRINPISEYHGLQNVTLDSLGYTSMQTKTLAMEFLEKASKLYPQSSRLMKYRKLVDLGYELAKEQSEGAFIQYTEYIQILREEERPAPGQWVRGPEGTE